MSTLAQNILLEQGAYIIIKNDTPIFPEEVSLLNYTIEADGIIDEENTLLGQFAILPYGESIVEANIVWFNLSKDLEGEDLNFQEKCNEQTTPYILAFKFTKETNYNQSIVITKVSLVFSAKQNADGTYGDGGKYPFYEKSIFRKNNRLYSFENLKWTYNVTNKLSGIGIVPTFITRTLDFAIFWEWLSHFYSCLVNYTRSFLKLYIDEDMLREYLLQKGVYLDPRVSPYQDIILEDFSLNILDKSRDETFNMFDSFKDRGTTSQKNQIKKLLKYYPKEDIFYNDFLKKSETAWFLGNYSPISTGLKSGLVIRDGKDYSFTKISFPNGYIFNFSENIESNISEHLEFTLSYSSFLEDVEINSLKSMAIFFDLTSNDLGGKSMIGSLVVGKEFNNLSIRSFDYNDGFIIIEGISSALSKKIRIPIRLINSIHNKEAKVDPFPIGNTSYFVLNKLTQDGIEATVNKISIRSIALFNTSTPNAFKSEPSTAEELILRNSLLSIKLLNAGTDNYYIKRFFIHKSTEDTSTCSYALVIASILTDQEVCRFSSLGEINPSGHIILEESNASGISGEAICVFSSMDLKILETRAFLINLTSSLVEDEVSISPALKLRKLYQNFNFLNPPLFNLFYLKNNSNYSIKKIENILEQQYTYYGSKSILLENNKENNLIFPFVFRDIKIINSLRWNWTNNSIIISINGGLEPYIYYLKDSNDTIYSQNTTGVFENIEEGVYSIVAKDSRELEITKSNITITTPDEINIEASLVKIPGTLEEVQALNDLNKFDKVFAIINGGIPPYYICYQTELNLNNFVIQEIVSKANLKVELSKKFRINEKIYILIADSTYDIYKTVETRYIISTLIDNTYLWIADEQGGGVTE